MYISVLCCSQEYKISDSEVSSNNSSERSDICCDRDAGENRDYFVGAGSYAPYQGEPLARNHDENSDGSEHEEVDEDGILPSVLEQRFNREISVDNW